MAKKKQTPEAEKEAAGEVKPGIKGLLKNKKLLLIIGIALGVCLVGGGAGYVILSKSKKGADQSGAEQASHGETKAETGEGGHGEGEKSAEGGKAEAKEEKPNVFDHVFSLDPLEVKLKEPDQERTLKIDMRVEMDKPELATEFKERKEMIHGALRSVLAGKNFSQLEGAEAKILLKMALIAELNRRLETGKVRNIYFTDFLII